MDTLSEIAECRKRREKSTKPSSEIRTRHFALCPYSVCPNNATKVSLLINVGKSN